MFRKACRSIAYKDLKSFVSTSLYSLNMGYSYALLNQQGQYFVTFTIHDRQADACLAA